MNELDLTPEEPITAPIEIIEPSAEPQSAARAETDSQIARLSEENDKLRDQLLRLQAEFENFRRRSRKEREEMRSVAGAEILEKLIPVIDNFSRAIRSPASSTEAFAAGVQMIHTHFLNLLKDSGLEQLQAEGQPFDPNLHEAVAVDSSGQYPENQVVEVMQDGYSLKGKLLRPALVKVSRHG